MKQFLAFVKKEFYHILRDKRTVLILLVMPIVQIILFGFAISNEVRNVKVGVLDPSKDTSTSRMVEQLDASEYFNVVTYIHTTNEIDKLFRKGEIDLIVVFEENFQDNLYHTGHAGIQLIADATDPNNAITLAGYATNIIQAYQQELNSLQAVPVQIVPEVRMLYNPRMKSAYNFVPGVMGLILMIICAMMISISIVREKETGTMEVLLASPVRPFTIITAKVVPYGVLSVVNLTTILLLSVFLLNVPISGSLFWLVVVSFLFIVVSLSLGILISSLVNNQVAAMLISGVVLLLPTMLLSGFIYPVENMPLPLKVLSAFIPARWFIEAVRKTMIEGIGVTYILKEMGILCVMALFLLMVSLKKFSNRLN